MLDELQELYLLPKNEELHNVMEWTNQISPFWLLDTKIDTPKINGLKKVSFKTYA